MALDAPYIDITFSTPAAISSICLGQPGISDIVNMRDQMSSRTKAHVSHKGRLKLKSRLGFPPAFCHGGICPRIVDHRSIRCKLRQFCSIRPLPWSRMPGTFTDRPVYTRWKESPAGYDTLGHQPRFGEAYIELLSLSWMAAS